MKTEGMLQDWARSQARWLLMSVMLSMAIISLWTPFLQPKIMERWFSWPNIALLSPVPIVTVWLALTLWRAIDRRSEFLPFMGAIALFTMGYLGLAISLWPNIVPAFNQPLGCGSRAALAGVPHRRHALLVASHRRIHGMVILGFPREGACRGRVSLNCTGACHADRR